MARTFSTGNYIGVSTAVVTAAPLTLSCWAYPTSTPANAVWLAVGVSGSQNNRFVIASSTTSIRAVARDATVAGIGSAPGTLATGTWQHLGGIFTSTTSRTGYLNGSGGTANTTSVTPTGANLTRVGAMPDGVEPAAGRIAEVAIWNVALSADEMAALSRGVSPLLIRTGNLAGYWPVWGQDSPEPDLSGQVNNMSLTGTPALADHAPVQPLLWRPLFLAPSGVVAYTQTKFRVYNDDGSGAI